MKIENFRFDLGNAAHRLAAGMALSRGLATETFYYQGKIVTDVRFSGIEVFSLQLNLQEDAVDVGEPNWVDLTEPRKLLDASMDSALDRLEFQPENISDTAFFCAGLGAVRQKVKAPAPAPAVRPLNFEELFSRSIWSDLVFKLSGPDLIAFEAWCCRQLDNDTTPLGRPRSGAFKRLVECRDYARFTGFNRWAETLTGFHV